MNTIYSQSEKEYELPLRLNRRAIELEDSTWSKSDNQAITCPRSLSYKIQSPKTRKRFQQLLVQHLIFIIRRTMT